MTALSETERRDLNSAFVKLRGLAGQTEIRLWPHEAAALFKEFCRLANFATLLGEPSPAVMAGLFTQEEAEAIADEFVGRKS